MSNTLHRPHICGVSDQPMACNDASPNTREKKRSKTDMKKCACTQITPFGEWPTRNNNCTTQYHYCEFCRTFNDKRDAIPLCSKGKCFTNTRL
jgi:hypothetical protein